jgi:nucleoside-diphosphate-sugar epimerase
MVFVTGGSGLIGGFLISALIAQGHTVRALYRQQEPRIPGADKVQWVEGDIRDTILLRTVLVGVTHVFHCAGLVSYAPQDEANLQQVNVEGTAAIIDACIEQTEAIRLCHVSSVAALGSPAVGKEVGQKADSIVDETAKWDLGAEHAAYATSKYFGELEVWRGISEGLSAVIVNPSVILGPANWERSSTRLFRYAHQEHTFYTTGNLNYVDVRDVVKAMFQLTFQSEVSGERFILSAGAVPLRHFLVDAAECFGKKPPTVAVPIWAAETIWRLEHMRSVLTGARPLITKDTARAGRKIVVYSAAKVQAVTGLRCRPLSETIQWSCAGLTSANQPSTGVVSGS